MPLILSASRALYHPWSSFCLIASEPHPINEWFYVAKFVPPEWSYVFSAHLFAVVFNLTFFISYFRSSNSILVRFHDFSSCFYFGNYPFPCHQLKYNIKAWYIHPWMHAYINRRITFCDCIGTQFLELHFHDPTVDHSLHHLTYRCIKDLVIRIPFTHSYVCFTASKLVIMQLLFSSGNGTWRSCFSPLHVYFRGWRSL